jgi:hypothetical protein
VDDGNDGNGKEDGEVISENYCPYTEDSLRVGYEEMVRGDLLHTEADYG